LVFQEYFKKVNRSNSSPPKSKQDLDGVSLLPDDEPATGYGATYPFALLGMVIFTIILHNLPM